MKLIVQKSSEAKRLVNEIKNIRELLSQLENEFRDKFEMDQEEDDNNENAEAEELIEAEEPVVSENDDEFLIRMTAPGFRKEDFIIEVSEDGVLSVNAGDKKQPSETESSMSPVNTNGFYHSFQLPEDANIDEIEAIYKNNVLTILIGKTTNDEVFDE